jgi:hypothetical protein
LFSSVIPAVVTSEASKNVFYRKTVFERRKGSEKGTRIDFLIFMMSSSTKSICQAHFMTPFHGKACASQWILGEGGGYKS